MTVYYQTQGAVPYVAFRPQLMHFKASKLNSVIDSYSDGAIADYAYELGLVKEALDSYNFYVFRNSIPKTQVNDKVKTKTADKFKWFEPAMRSELQQLQMDYDKLVTYEKTVANKTASELRFDVEYQQYLDGNTSDEIGLALHVVQAFIDRGYPKVSDEYQVAN